MAVFNSRQFVVVSRKLQILLSALSSMFWLLAHSNNEKHILVNEKPSNSFTIAMKTFLARTIAGGVRERDYESYMKSGTFLLPLFPLSTFRECWGVSSAKGWQKLFETKIVAIQSNPKYFIECGETALMTIYQMVPFRICIQNNFRHTPYRKIPIRIFCECCFVPPFDMPSLFLWKTFFSICIYICYI